MQIHGRKKLLSERHVCPFVAHVVCVVVHLKVRCLVVLFSCFLFRFVFIRVCQRTSVPLDGSRDSDRH